MLILLSQNKIAGVSRLLAVALHSGESPEVIILRLQQAISGTYTPQSGWTDKDYDVAFLVKAIGGPRLLYALQHAEGYPSATSLRRCKPIPDNAVSPGIPHATEIDMNIQAFLGPKLPPKIKKQTVVIDGVALEEQYFTVPLPFLQESSGIHRNLQESSGMAPESAGMGQE